MIHCPKCAKDVHPTTDIGGAFDLGGNRAAKPVLLCPQCEQFLGEADGAPVNQAPRIAPVIALRGPTALSKPIQIIEAQSIESQLTARLAQIDQELARFGELKNEARRLRAMLKAASRACRN